MRIVVAALLAFASGPVLALGEPVTNSSELMGCWKRHVYSEAAMRRISTLDLYNPKTQKYQWFCFNEGGEFRALTMSKDADLTSADIAKYVELLPKTMSWNLIGRGVVRVEHKQDPRQTGNWLVSFGTKPERIDSDVTVKEGTLFMGFTNKERTRYALLRVLERIK